LIVSNLSNFSNWRSFRPDIIPSDLLVINKTDLAQAVGADLDVMARDSKKMRGSGPFVFAQVKYGVGIDEITDHILHSFQHASGIAHTHSGPLAVPRADKDRKRLCGNRLCHYRREVGRQLRKDLHTSCYENTTSTDSLISDLVLGLRRCMRLGHRFDCRRALARRGFARGDLARAHPVTPGFGADPSSCWRE